MIWKHCSQLSHVINMIVFLLLSFCCPRVKNCFVLVCVYFLHYHESNPKLFFNCLDLSMHLGASGTHFLLPYKGSPAVFQLLPSARHHPEFSPFHHPEALCLSHTGSPLFGAPCLPFGLCSHFGDVHCKEKKIKNKRLILSIENETFFF